MSATRGTGMQERCQQVKGPQAMGLLGLCQQLEKGT